MAGGGGGGRAKRAQPARALPRAGWFGGLGAFGPQAAKHRRPPPPARRRTCQFSANKKYCRGNVPGNVILDINVYCSN